MNDNKNKEIKVEDNKNNNIQIQSDLLTEDDKKNDCYLTNWSETNCRSGKDSNGKLICDQISKIVKNCPGKGQVCSYLLSIVLFFFLFKNISIIFFLIK